MKNTSLADSYLSLVDALSAIHLLSELDLEGIPESVLLQNSLSALMKHQDLENCSLFLLRDERLVCSAAIHKTTPLQVNPEVIGKERLTGVSFAVGEGIIGTTFSTGTIQRCDDCISDERFRVFLDAGLFPEAGSFIAIPVKSGESVLGVLSVVHLIPGFFEYWHEHFLSLYGNCLGRFLHDHRLLHNLEGLITQRTIELEHALSESEDLRQRYQRLSTTDDLTGLHNRRHFFIEGEAMLARALRDKTAISLLLVDIDYFKRINDTWGHAIGDRVLRLIADALRVQARAGDMVARLGGEEFVLLLPNTGPVGADLMAKRIQERFATLDLGGSMENMVLTASIGITSMQSDCQGDLSDKLQEVYKQADCAMYTCKAQGRNRRLFYVPGMYESANQL
ncbi:MAG: sensor domain-containing diguanylate cyclase [Gammaproteobacteria bacterium]|nr:sensor domain-containing diguanylate cyclase [Gammaproteobacteria bacterium]